METTPGPKNTFLYGQVRLNLKNGPNFQNFSPGPLTDDFNHVDD